MEAKGQPLAQQEFTIIERVARIVSSVRGTKPDYAHLAAELAPAIPFDLFGIVLLRHDRQAVRVIVCKYEAGEWVASYHQHPLADSMLEHFLRASASTQERGEGAARTEAGTSLDSPATEPGDNLASIRVHNYPDGLDGSPAESGDALSGNPHLHATLIAPLIAGSRVLGTLELGSVTFGAYDDGQLQRLIAAVVRVLAAAIESAQVGGNVEIQDRQREELKQVSSALTSEMDLSMILNRIVAGIGKALKVASAIVTLDQHTGGLRLEAQYGLDPEILGGIIAGKAALSEKSIISFTLLRRQPCVSNDIAQDERFPASRVFATELGVRSIFSYPLVTGSTVYGALALFSPDPGGFTPLKSDILSLFASQATIAIHNGMLLESARQRRRFQEAIEQLEKTHQQRTSAEDEQAILERVREQSERTFGISFGSLLHFISDNLLTRGERDLQAILQALQEERRGGPGRALALTERSSQAQDAPAPLSESQEIPGVFLSKAQEPEASRELEVHSEPGAQVLPGSPAREEGTAVLIRTAEAALARAGLLGNVGAALAAFDPVPVLSKDASALPQFYERGQDPWFIVDLRGRCIYVNRAAEVFCGMRLDLDNLGAMETRFLASSSETGVSHAHALTLEEALAGLLPRVRNIEEVLAYLQEFAQAEQPGRPAGISAGELPWTGQANAPRLNPLPINTLRCVIAAEPVQRSTAAPVHDFPGESRGMELHHLKPRMVQAPRNRLVVSHSMLLDNAPADRHYRFMRYCLYDQHGQFIANALQIHDITEQVRDEKNKSVLLSSVSHDLRTPLTAIKAAVSGLLQPGVAWDEKTRREMLEEIDAETDHLNTLINSMVEMSRIDMGALVLEKEWCDLVEIVHSTISRMERLLADHPVCIEFQPRLPLIRVDYEQLKRVFHNLLENAVRHSPKHAEILITAHTFSDSSLSDEVTGVVPRFLRVQMIDHGKGVAEEERERIFKSFYSLDAQHTGLGLAICRGIIEAHHGRIWVESAPDGGACFVFVLPISS